MVAETEPVLIQSLLSQHCTTPVFILSMLDRTAPLRQNVYWFRRIMAGSDQRRQHSHWFNQKDRLLQTSAWEGTWRCSVLSKSESLQPVRNSITDWALWRHCRVSNGTKPVFTGLISGWSKNAVNPYYWKFFSTLPIAFAVLNRRPYYWSVADCRLRNKPKPLAELTLFPSDLLRLTGDQCWRPG